MAESESGAAGVEVLEGDDCTPDAVAAALCAMTFAMGRRFVIADGVERWKDADVAVVADAMKGSTPRPLHGRVLRPRGGPPKVPAALRKAVEAAGGEVAREGNVKPLGAARAGSSRAPRAGHRARPARRARALVAHVGDRQQRLLRELEKLALEHGAGRRLGAAEVDASSAGSAERKTWTLADALVAGDQRPRRARCSSCASRASACPGCCTGWCAACAMRSRSRRRSRAGSRRAQVKGAADAALARPTRLVADVAQAPTSRRSARALELLADLELESRGGGGGVLSEDTAAVRAVIRVRARSARRWRRTAGRARRWRGAGGPRGTSCARRCCVCIAPRLTALSISWTRRRCSASACSASPAATAASRRRK